MMGCGKTTVSAALNKKYNLQRVDTDEVIVEKYGSINAIFAEHGEEYFRDLETSVTKLITENYKNAVISLGGGCVLRNENVQNLKRSGRIFYLRTSLATLIKRVEGDKTRPLLKGDAKQKMTDILAVRAPIYERVADVIIDTDGLSPKEIATKIMEHMQ
jgi:shikimate kinase